MRRRDGRTRRRGLTAAGIALLLVAAAVVAGRLLIITVGDLRQGEQAMLNARTAMAAGDLGAARDAAQDAADAFGRASQRLSAIVGRSAASIPALGNNVEVLQAVAVSGQAAAGAGEKLLAALGTLRDSLAQERGAVGASLVQDVEAIGPDIRQASERLRSGMLVMQRSPTAWLVPEMRQGRGEVLEQLIGATEGLSAAADLVEVLPAFLGAEEPKRYFFAAANPAELRGTSGFIGAFAVLTIDQGRFSFSEFRSIADLPNRPVSAVPAPNPSFAARYNGYGGAGFWRNINMTPDFPSAATAIETLYEEVSGQRLDGTILVDPFALRALLGHLEPIEVPHLGAVGPGEVVDVFTNRAYARFADADRRKQVLGAVAAGTFQEFMRTALAKEPLSATRTLAASTAAGHLLFHATDPEVQAAFEATGIAGRLLQTDGDYLSVVANASHAAKLDYYTERSIRYEADLEPGGRIDGLVTVELRNDAPTSGLPRTVIGPGVPDAQPGENVTLLSLYCTDQCLLDSVQVSDSDVPVSSQIELGHRVYDVRFGVPSESTGVAAFDLAVGNGWTSDDDDGAYRLMFQGQTTIKPVSLEVDIQIPDGMEVTSTEPAMTVAGRHVRWSGVPENLMTFEVQLSRPESLSEEFQDLMERVAG